LARRVSEASDPVGLNSMPGLAENRRTERLSPCCEDPGALEFLPFGTVQPRFACVVLIG